MSSHHNFISLTSVSNLRLEHFETQHELARNFYDDHEFCPVYQFDEVAEHRERIQKRTSPHPSPSHSPPSYYISPKQQRPQLNSHHSSSASVTRAIPIIDPSNMTPVSVPSMQQQHYSAKASSTSPSMNQWSAYKNNSTSTSPKSSSSSICSMSSSTSSSSSSSSSSVSTSPPTHHLHQNSITNHNNHPSYYYGNSNCSIPTTTIHYNNHYHYHQQPQMMPIVARAIPIIDPATRQVYRQQQQTSNIPPGFYNVSVC